MFNQNRLGRNFENGKSTPQTIKNDIIRFYSEGKSIPAISKVVRLTERGIRKTISAYIETGSLEPKLHPGLVPYMTTNNVLQHIEFYKTQKPSTYSREIQDKLIENGACNNDTVPSIRTISHVIQNELGFTRKRLTVTPEESLTVRAQAKLDQYLEDISEFRAGNIHFMDESSVDRTTGNRTYGHSLSGEPAVEICRYSSDATFTLNLMCGFFGVDHYNIVEGPSNGWELLEFFTEALNETYENGNPKIAAGDVVVMDNCGFHHARHVEPVLRQILIQRDVTLVYQPPYSPELNPCEYAFNHIKRLLKNNEKFTARFTELAIVNALEFITPTLCSSFFKKCGYAH